MDPSELPHAGSVGRRRNKTKRQRGRERWRGGRGWFPAARLGTPFDGPWGSRVVSRVAAATYSAVPVHTPQSCRRYRVRTTRGGTAIYSARLLQIRHTLAWVGTLECYPSESARRCARPALALEEEARVSALLPPRERGRGTLEACPGDTDDGNLQHLEPSSRPVLRQT